ncbi:MAG: DnaA/Hda family protein [Phycisphaerales bacterium]
MTTKSLIGAAERRGENGGSKAAGSGGGFSGAGQFEAQRSVTPRLMEALAREGAQERAERYLRQASDVRLTGDVLEVVAPSSFVADLISRRLGGDLCRVASEALLDGRKAELRFRIDDRAAPPRQAPQAEPARTRPVVVTAPAAQSRHRLEDFVVGASNRLAHAAALRLAQEQHVTSLSPLFIHSACGMGKTHLLHGIAARFQELNPGAKVRCVSAEAFTNEFIASIRAGSVEGFRRTHRRLALLCIDDVHFLASKEATQTELLHTLDAVGLDRARIVLASDEHPREIRKLSTALASRFMSGAVLRIEEPDRELRIELGRRLGFKRGLQLDDTGAAALAAAAWKSVRELEGLLMQILAVSRLLPELASAEAMDAAAVRRALDLAGAKPEPRTSASPRPRRPVPMSLIQAEVARRLRVELSDMAGRGRHPRVVLARSIVVRLARRLTTLSFPEIARAMNRPNHSSVITAHNRLLEQLRVSTPQAGGSAIALGEMDVEICPDLAATTLADLCESLERDAVRIAESD